MLLRVLSILFLGALVTSTAVQGPVSTVLNTVAVWNNAVGSSIKGSTPKVLGNNALSIPDGIDMDIGITPVFGEIEESVIDIYINTKYTATFSGCGFSNGNTKITLTRIGNNVHAHIEPIYAFCTNTNAFINTVAIPSEFRPGADTVSLKSVLNVYGGLGSVGVTTAGYIIIYGTATAGTGFTVGSWGGIQYAIDLSWQAQTQS